MLALDVCHRGDGPFAEVFELPYIMILLGIQILALLNAKDTAAPNARIVSMRVNAGAQAPPPPKWQTEPEPQAAGWIGRPRP